MRRRPWALGAVLALFLLSLVPGCGRPDWRARFDTADDFFSRFDYGYSGHNPWEWGNGSGAGAILHFHGDHNDACEGPETDRTVSFGGDVNRLDFSQVFWWCGPSGPASGHVMTGVNTVSYNTAWFSPKPYFTDVKRVCWDVNLTQMSRRKWFQVLFVSPDDATRYPSDRGSGGFDLGYTDPDFQNPAGPSTLIFPQGGTLAGFVSVNGDANWFQDQTTWTFKPYFYPPDSVSLGNTDKATRYTHCLENMPSLGVVRLTQLTPDGGVRSVDMPGEIPRGPVRVVFEDENYDPPKDAPPETGDGIYSPDVVTWHWDDVRIASES